MRHSLLGIILLTSLVPCFSECGNATNGAAVAPEQDELTQFLQDNPEIANEVYEEVTEGANDK